MWRLSFFFTLSFSLAACGARAKQGSVADGNSISDKEEEASKRPNSRPTPPPTKKTSPDSNSVSEVETPPITIPSGRMFRGYIVGGLPSKAQFDAALAADIDSAMSLMTNTESEGNEIASYAASHGVRYLHFAIDGKKGLTEATAWEFAATLSTLGTPAIIHSREGRRVGAIFALMAFFVDEMSAEEAFAIGVSAGMGDFSDQVRKQLGLPPT